MADRLQSSYTCSSEQFLGLSFCFCQGFDKFLVPSLLWVPHLRAFSAHCEFSCLLWALVWQQTLHLISLKLIALTAMQRQQPLHRQTMKNKDLMYQERQLRAFGGFQCLWVLWFFLFSVTPTWAQLPWPPVSLQEQKHFNQCWSETSLF